MQVGQALREPKSSKFTDFSTLRLSCAYFSAPKFQISSVQMPVLVFCLGVYFARGFPLARSYCRWTRIDLKNVPCESVWFVVPVSQIIRALRVIGFCGLVKSDLPRWACWRDVFQGCSRCEGLSKFTGDVELFEPTSHDPRKP